MVGVQTRIVLAVGALYALCWPYWAERRAALYVALHFMMLQWGKLEPGRVCVTQADLR